MISVKKTAIAVITVLLTLGVVTVANAAGNSRCQVIYGGGEVCEKEISFTLDKLVRQPGKGGGNFVQNLTINDPKYSAGQNVEFKIVITNTGKNRIDNATVVDTLPTYLEFVSGAGNYDQSTRKLTYTVTNLDAGKSVEQTIVARVVEDSKLPQDKGSLCVVNNVEARESNGSTASDSSQVCIERQVLGAKPTPQVYENVPVKKIPETGPEMLTLLGVIPAVIAGYTLRKKSKLN